MTRTEPKMDQLKSACISPWHFPLHAIDIPLHNHSHITAATLLNVVRLCFAVTTSDRCPFSPISLLPIKKIKFIVVFHQPYWEMPTILVLEKNVLQTRGLIMKEKSLNVRGPPKQGHSSSLPTDRRSCNLAVRISHGSVLTHHPRAS